MKPPVDLKRGPQGGKPSWLYLHPAQMKVFKSSARFKVVVAGRRWGKCLVKSTMIDMWDGTQKRIEDVVEGDIVATINEDTHEMQPRRVDGVKCNGKREVLRLKTSAREIVGTPHHPMFVNGKWVELQDVVADDLIGVGKTLPFGAKPIPDHEVDLLAIWLAEGAGYTISNGDQEILSTIDRAIARLDSDLFRKHSSGVDWWITNGSGPGQFKTRKNSFRSMLERHGVWGLNSKTKHIPDVIFSLPEHQLARFLNLFIACDGNISHRSKDIHSVEIGLTNERMLRQLSSLLQKFGIRGSIRKKTHRETGKDGNNFVSWRLSVCRSEEVIRFSDRVGCDLKQAAVAKAADAARRSVLGRNDFLPISYDSFVPSIGDERAEIGKYGGYNACVTRGLPEVCRQQLNSWRKNNRTRVSRSRFEMLRAFSDDRFDHVADADVAWERVVSIEPAGEEITYDLSIEGNHNYIANGAISHNTQLGKVFLVKKASVPKSLVWYIAPTYQMARQIMWQELLDTIPRKMVKRIHETMMTLWLKNGSVIQLKGADKPDTLRGVGLHAVVMDEFQDMRAETWSTVIQPTLASTGGEVLFIGTPRAFNHLHSVYMDGQSYEHTDWESWQFKTITSPFIPPEEIERARRTMNEKEFRQEFEASFESMSNRVYHAFDRDVHVGRVKMDPRYEILVGMDFNVDPMSAIFFQIRDGNVRVFGEKIMTNSSTAEMSEELDRLFWRQKRRVVIYPDPAGTQRSSAATGGVSDFAILRDLGFKRLKYRRQHPRIRDRVNAVNRMLMSGDGTSRVLIDHTCKRLIESFEQTQYKPGTSDIDKRPGMEHPTDAFGYPIEIEFPVRNIQLMGVSF